MSLPLRAYLSQLNDAAATAANTGIDVVKLLPISHSTKQFRKNFSLYFLNYSNIGMFYIKYVNLDMEMKSNVNLYK